MKFYGSLFSLFTIIALITQTEVAALPTGSELSVHVTQRTPSSNVAPLDDTLTRRAARRPPPRKVTPKKVAAKKKPTVKKAAPKKAVAKKSVPKKAVASKAPPKKTAPKKTATAAKTKGVAKAKIVPAAKSKTAAKAIVPKKTAAKTATAPSAKNAKAAKTPATTPAGQVCRRAPGKDGKTATTCKPVKSDKCSAQLGCGQCVLAGCGFNKQTMACQSKSANPLLITGSGTVPKACLPINQMQGLFPRKKSLSKQKGVKSGVSNAGVIPANIKPGILSPILLNHVFKGTGLNGAAAESAKSGRHLRSVFERANRGAKVTSTNNAAKILAFGDKTVWEDGPGGYDQQDIINMCAVAIKASGVGAIEGNRVVQTKFGSPICVSWFTKGTGSCFPLGTKPPRGKRLGADCTGNDSATD